MGERPDRLAGPFLTSLKEFLSEATRPATPAREHDITYCRENAARAILLLTLIAVTCALAGPVVEAAQGRPGPILMIRAASIIVALILYFQRGLRPATLFYTMAAMFWLAGAGTFVVGGSYTAEGIALLCGAPLLAGFFLGMGPGFWMLSASTALLGALAAGSASASLPFPGLSPGAVNLAWPFLFMDAVFLIGVGFLCRQTARSAQEALIARKEAAAFEALLREERAETDAASRSLGQSRNEIRRHQALFQGLVEHSADIVLLLDADGRIRICGQAVQSLTGFSPDELSGRELFSFLPDDQARDQRAMFASSLLAGTPTFSSFFSLARKDGTELPVEAMASNYLHNPDIQAVLMTLRDMTRQRTAEARAEFYQHYDPLTSLPNRDSFIQAVERTVTIARNRNRVFAVMALGLDRFKRVNDLFGTDIGDQVLKTAAGWLRASFRNDDVVSRYRGDKFFALFPDIRSQDHIKEIIGKARMAFRQPVHLDIGEDVKLSASIGVALYPNDGRNAEDLIRNAETALYMAKESGRDRYRLFDARLNGDIIKRQKIENDLNVALERGGLLPYFQPKVDRNGCIIGAESLVRWRHPSGELKSPAYFIDVAEKSGNIDSIGSLMLRMTCQTASSWFSAGLPKVPISVNLSPRQFGREDLIDDIKRALDSTGLDPRLLEFEITETGIMENEREGIRKLLKLKDLGSAISIDDFGTGYSSFSKLKDYPVDTVKLDKSFIDPLPHDRKATIIASAIVDMAHTLSFSVVAEGIERRDQMLFLDTIFCDAYQGYLFSAPVPEHEFRAFLESGQPLAV